LIIAVLTILILQSLAVVVDAPSLIFTGVVVLTIVVPTLLLWSYAVGLPPSTRITLRWTRAAGSVFSPTCSVQAEGALNSRRRRVKLKPLCCIA